MTKSVGDKDPSERRVISGDVGISYGSEIPVNFFIFPNLANLYSPFESLSSHFSKGVLTNTSKYPPYFEINRLLYSRSFSYGAIGAQMAMPRLLVISLAT